MIGPILSKSGIYFICEDPQCEFSFPQYRAIIVDVGMVDGLKIRNADLFFNIFKKIFLKLRIFKTKNAQCLFFFPHNRAKIP